MQREGYRSEHFRNAARAIRQEMDRVISGVDEETSAENARQAALQKREAEIRDELAQLADAKAAQEIRAIEGLK